MIAKIVYCGNRKRIKNRTYNRAPTPPPVTKVQLNEMTYNPKNYFRYANGILYQKVLTYIPLI